MLARLRLRGRDDTGSAVIEFVVLVVLVLMPLVYVVIAVMQVQAASYAATQAVREAGRVFAQADSPVQGRQVATAAAALALADQGFAPLNAPLALTCSTAVCLAPGSTVEARISMRVRLPFLPDWLAETTAGSIPVTVTHRTPVDVYRTSS